MVRLREQLLDECWHTKLLNWVQARRQKQCTKTVKERYIYLMRWSAEACNKEIGATETSGLRMRETPVIAQAQVHNIVHSYFCYRTGISVRAVCNFDG